MAVWALVVPTASAAYNDVTLTTATVLSVGGIEVDISGSSAVIQSITVNPTNFSFTLPSGSLERSAPTLRWLIPAMPD